MPYMYASYVCLICMPYMQPARAVRDYRMPYMYALYVSLICMPYMYALYVCEQFVATKTDLQSSLQTTEVFFFCVCINQCMYKYTYVTYVYLYIHCTYLHTTYVYLHIYILGLDLNSEMH